MGAGAGGVGGVFYLRPRPGPPEGGALSLGPLKNVPPSPGPLVPGPCGDAPRLLSS